MAIIDRTIPSFPLPERRSKKPISLFLIIVLASSLMTTIVLLKLQESDDALSNPSAPVRIAYETHSPILINGDAGFIGDISSTGVSSGDGTASDPYIIEGWEISAASANGIEIRYSDVHFIIRGCNIHDGGASNFGIYLLGCKNGTLESNICAYNWYGIIFRFSGDSTISKNDCSNNSVCGIDFGTSGNSVLDNNTCTHNDVGISLGNSGNNTLRSNICNLNNLDGVCIKTPMPSYIPPPPWPTTSIDNSLLGNQLCDNLQYGVSIDSYSSSNQIWNNTLTGNNGAGSVYDSDHIQANDSGTNNWWNSTDGYGNYWSDWAAPDVDEDGVVDIPYSIDGSAGSVDHYPLTTTTTVIPEYSSPLVIISFVMIMVAIFAISGRREKGP